MSEKKAELARIEDLLRIDMKNRPADDFVRSFMGQLEGGPLNLLRTFRKNLSEILIEREASQKGHLKVDPLAELLEISRFQSWLQDNGLHERASRIVWQGLQNRSSEELTRTIRSGAYVSETSADLIDFLLAAGVEESDASTFVHLTEEMDVSVTELIHLVFKINFRAESAVREEALRGTMSLKEMISLYIYSTLQVALSEYGLQEDIIAEMSNRLALCNNMKRQFLIVHQVERIFFGAHSADEVRKKNRNEWIKQINDIELKIALEQYVTHEKLGTSDMELAEIYTEAHHIFDDVSDLKDETLAVISITYRLDNPEETGHTVEELLAMIDQIKLLTLEFGPLNILTRDVFQFFEILGESDHHNHLFRQTILTFRRQLKKIGEQTRKMGERVTLNQLILAYLYSRLDAYLEDYEGDKTRLLEGIQSRLSHCHDYHRQFAIVDLIERHLFANPGLIQIADEYYWTELINTFELNIILEIYIERGYLTGGLQNMSKNQILDRIQSHINNINDISVKSLTVVFLTAQLSALVEQSKDRKVTVDDMIKTIDHLNRDAEQAASQINVQNRVKRDLLSTLTERLFRLEAIQSALSESSDMEIISRLDEVVVGLRTRRDNLISGKMDPNALEKDVNSFLHDPKVIRLMDEVEEHYKQQLAHKSHVAAKR